MTKVNDSLGSYLKIGIPKIYSNNKMVVRKKKDGFMFSMEGEYGVLVSDEELRELIEYLKE